ncbi:MAG: spondin domain-containing protein [Gammaproteobacteria bacterium]|nr:spondin domain-containing protein [Gammaproteobacteria bacterium]
MKKQIMGLMVASALSSSVIAQDLTVELTNLTNAVYFTPLLVSTHNANTHLFQAGTTASAHLQAMAEGGDISGLTTDLMSIAANTVENPAAGLLAPGASTTAMLKSDRNNSHLSLVGMLLPTNDGFVGLDALKVPKKKGSYTYYLHAYDAGTEANNEVINGGGAPGVLGIPADPGGHAGSGATGITEVEANTTVHIHSGIIGDMDASGGKSDLDSAAHRWLNPVAKLTITVSDDKDEHGHH